MTPEAQRNPRARKEAGINKAEEPGFWRPGKEEREEDSRIPVRSSRDGNGKMGYFDIDRLPSICPAKTGR